MRYLVAPLIAAALVLASLAMAGEKKSARQTDEFRQANDVRLIEGVWRSRGYGRLMVVEDGHARFYDESARFCHFDADASVTFGNPARTFQISADARSIRLPISDATYRFTFDRIARLPSACLADPDDDPLAVFEVFVDLFDRHYAFFGARGIDWPKIVRTARRWLAADPSEARLYHVLRDMVSRFGDAHVSIEGKFNGRAFYHDGATGKTTRIVASLARGSGLDFGDFYARWLPQYWNREIGRTLLRGRASEFAGGMIRFGLIDGDIGYLAIRSMSGFAARADREAAVLDRAMQRAMRLFAGARAVIVDLSVNDGGHDYLARRIAGHFAARRTTGYYKYAADDRTSRPQAVAIEPSAGRRYTGPVYLMTTDATLSAAEILTLAMRALPNVTHVGEPTSGALSDILQKTLPNGWRVSLSNEVYLDVGGQLWEGVGIVPEVPLQIFADDDVRVGHVAAVRKVVRMIREAHPSGRTAAQ